MTLAYAAGTLCAAPTLPDELAAEDSVVAEYVASLEQMQDATELPEASGDAIAAEFERYLRRRQG